MDGRRLLLVHAHPDDESINTGATMAYYAAQGAAVTLLTCTLGEEGDILEPAYARLGATAADQLGGYRIGELAAAVRALGVTDHRFLGGAGHFRDSGMAGSAASGHPRAFWRADRDPDVYAAAVAAAVEVIRDIRPQVVITYDDNGDYGHPDHIMAHRVTTAAVVAAADPAYGAAPVWTVAKLYWTATRVADLHAGAVAVRGRTDLAFTPAEAPEPQFGVPDDVITTSIDASDFVAAKTAALAAHRTQVLLDPPYFALSNLLGREVLGVEHYRLIRGTRGPVGADGREHDLFAGLA